MGEARVLTYVYCVADVAKLAASKETPRGLPHAEKPRVLALGDGLAMIVASVPATEYSSAKIDARLKDLEWVSSCAIGHERVVEHYTKKTTVIPMKLFTLFSSDERAMKDVSRKKKTIARTMKKLAGREEWGVRVFFDELAALEKVTKQNGAARPSSGRDFLTRKKGERDVQKQAQQLAAQEAADVYEALALASDDALRRTAPAVTGGARVVLDAAFLVAKRANKKFKTAVAKQAKRLGELGYDVKLTGPWPPYNFVGEGA